MQLNFRRRPQSRFFSRADSDSERTHEYSVPDDIHLSQHVAHGTGLTGNNQVPLPQTTSH